ncbi:metal-sulfur cluster assembly factor [Patescibacteria group bacterium]|nr:metal-sulfur cluster assembly factor [Patescibacteria group bacterium]
MTTEETPHQEMLEIIQQQLMTVYDPEFPVIDIYTLGLIYNISIDEPNQTINILMTFTTPQCPMGEMIEQMIKNSLLEVYPTWNAALEITFDPLRSPKMMKDEDLIKMFFN